MKRWQTAVLGLVALFLAAAPSGAARAAEPESFPIAEDHSLTGEQYVGLGVPASDRLWSADDYQQAAKALQKLLNEDSTKLPRLSSPRSGGLFARLVSPENMTLAESMGSGPGPRLNYLGAQLNPGVIEILKIYMTATNQGTSFDAELAEILLFVGIVADKTWDSMDAFEAELSPDDPQYEVRMEGLETARGGLALIVGGFLTTLTEKTVYRQEILVDLAKRLRPLFPRMVARLSTESRLEIPIRLDSLVEAETEPELKAALRALRASLNAPAQ
jgi:hypothetical protein